MTFIYNQPQIAALQIKTNPHTHTVRRPSRRCRTRLQRGSVWPRLPSQLLPVAHLACTCDLPPLMNTLLLLFHQEPRRCGYCPRGERLRCRNWTLKRELEQPAGVSLSQWSLIHNPTVVQPHYSHGRDGLSSCVRDGENGSSLGSKFKKLEAFIK